MFKILTARVVFGKYSSSRYPCKLLSKADIIFLICSPVNWCADFSVIWAFRRNVFVTVTYFRYKSKFADSEPSISSYKSTSAIKAGVSTRWTFSVRVLSCKTHFPRGNFCAILVHATWYAVFVNWHVTMDYLPPSLTLAERTYL